MSKILLILVGGTICCEVNEFGALSVGEKAGSKLISDFSRSGSRFVNDVEFVLSENLGILSENMTVEKWNQIIEVYRRHITTDNFDGVIIAHGTDTLAYTAALFSVLLSNTEIPVFFVSSNKALDDPSANGSHNFKCAVELICGAMTPNIYVPYKNVSDGVMYLHLASRITQCQNYSDDFYSVGMRNISEFSKDYSLAAGALQNDYGNGESAVDINGEWRLKDCVLLLEPYVGLNYDAYRYDLFSAVLHGTYHSGTACAEQIGSEPLYGRNSILHMFDLCASSGVDVYVSPCKTSGRVYDTIRIISSFTANGKKIKCIFGTTKEIAYAKLLIAYSLFDNEQSIESFMEREYNYENICK